MKVSSTIKKMVVVSVFCSQVLTLLPMQEIAHAEPRVARGLSLMSLASDVTLPTGEVPATEEPKERDVKAEQADRKIRLQTLFGGDEAGTHTMYVPGQYQEDVDLEQAARIVIKADETDPKILKDLEGRKATLAARLSLDDAAAIAPAQEGTLTAHPSAIALESGVHAIDISVAPTQAEADAKVEQVRQETNKINKLIEDIKQLMEKAKGPVAKAIKKSTFLIVATNLIIFIWSTVDADKHTETLPYATLIAAAAFTVLTATAQVLQWIHNKLKQEVEEHDEFIPEDHPSSIPQSNMSFKQRLTTNCLNCWSKVIKCLSKIEVMHLISGVGLASVGITTTAALRPDIISPLVAEWTENTEFILDVILAIHATLLNKGINRLTATLARREAQRRHGSVGGTVHPDIELNTLRDTRPTHGTKGSVEMVGSLPAPETTIAMTINPLVVGEPLAIETGAETQSNTPTPEKEKRHSSEESTPDPLAKKQLDFKEAEAEPTI